MTTITPARLCELEAEVCACGSGVNIGIVHWTALMGREWCDEEDGEDGDPLTEDCRRDTP